MNKKQSQHIMFFVSENLGRYHKKKIIKNKYF